MQRLTQAELGEPDVELIIRPERVVWATQYKPLADLLFGYIPREQPDGSWKYTIPAYLARQVEALCNSDWQMIGAGAIDDLPILFPRRGAQK